MVTLQERKAFGSFYTPKLLANLLASTIISLSKKINREICTVVDPATGDSSLLSSFYDYASNIGIKTRYVGVDIDECAIEKSKELFASKNIDAVFLKKDAIYPYASMSSISGWNELRKKYIPNGIDFIVSNPPWGADKSKYSNLNIDFETAHGQFDLYDIFVEIIINNLNENGCYGIIVPDTVYEEEHSVVRKLLLENTILMKIIRIGEGFFDNVNIATTLLFGIKKSSKNYDIECSHFSEETKKKVLSGKIEILDAVKDCSVKIPVQLMRNFGYKFLTDVKEDDVAIIDKIENAKKVNDVANSQRGIELSKKGYVIKCPKCSKWLPEPRKKAPNDNVLCPFCRERFLLIVSTKRCIVSDKKNANNEKFITGESIYRYNTVSNVYIEKGYDGINYKSDELYHGSKILVRKTGVGITAGMDYKNCLTNQVVYILKRKKEIASCITNEVILAVINSRVITYYLIVINGCNGWKTHSYLSQKDVATLPFPNIDFSNVKTMGLLKELTLLVKRNSNGKADDFPKNADVRIERIIAYLFGLNKKDYKVILNTIKSVQQMIPFKRLVNITENEIFSNGI